MIGLKHTHTHTHVHTHARARTHTCTHTHTYTHARMHAHTHTHTLCIWHKSSVHVAEKSLKFWSLISLMNASAIIRRADCISTKSRVQLEDSVFLEIINETAAVSEQSLQQCFIFNASKHQTTDWWVSWGREDIKSIKRKQMGLKSVKINYTIRWIIIK